MRPGGWVDTAIGDCVEAVRTTNPARTFGDGEFDYVDLGAVDQRAKVITGPSRTKGIEAPSRARQLIAAGDVVVSTVRPNLNAVARVGQDLDGAIASTGFCVLRPTADVDGGYLFHWVRSPPFVNEMVRRATGASYPAVSDRIVRESTLPLPSLEEQRRIARILDTADSVRSARRTSLAVQSQFPLALFVRAFGDPCAPKSPWPLYPLHEVCEAINDCPHSTPRWTSDGAVCLRTSNLTEGDWDWSDRRFVSEETFRLRSTRGNLEPGDIVLSREGTVGVAAIVPEDMHACMGQRLVQLRPNQTRSTPEYLLRYLLSVLHPDRIGRVMVGSTARHINVKELRSLLVPVAPIDLQVRYAATMARFRRRLDATVRHLAHADALFAALQHRAFTGAL